MFATIAFSVLGLLTLIILRDGMHYRFFRRSRTKKTLKKIAQHIVFCQWEEAEQELQLVSHKSNKEVVLLHSQVLRGTQRYEAALSIINQAIKVHGDELILALEKGKILTELGFFQEAFEYLQKAKLLLRNEDDFTFFAKAAVASNHADMAWEMIEPLLEFTQNSTIFMIAGDIQVNTNDPSKAIFYYTRAIDTIAEADSKVDLAIILTKLGHVYLGLGNLQEAEVIFQKVLNKDSGDVNATLGLGACYQERGQYLKALHIYQTGRAWEKKDPKILFEAGLLSIHTHRYSHAAHYFSHLIESYGAKAEWLTYYGYALEKTKNWQKAEEIYMYLLQLYPNHHQGYLALAWLFGVGFSSKISCETALSYAYQAAQLHPSSLSWEIVSACEARAGHFEKAHRIQEQLASQETQVQQRHRHLEAMRHLRKQLPLEDHHVLKT